MPSSQHRYVAHFGTLVPGPWVCGCLCERERAGLQTLAAKIGDKFDTKKEAQLGIKEVGMILNLTGVYYTPEQLESMWTDLGAKGYHAIFLEDKISRTEFINVHNRMAPSAVFPIAVLFF